MPKILKEFLKCKGLLCLLLALCCLFGCSRSDTGNAPGSNGSNNRVDATERTSQPAAGNEVSSSHSDAKASDLIGHTFEYQYDDQSYRAETTFYDSYFIDTIYENGREYSSEKGEVLYQGSDFTCEFEDGSSIRYYYTDDQQQAYDDQYYYYYNGKILIWGTEKYTQIH